MSVHLFGLSVVLQGDIHISQDYKFVWYCQLEEPQAEMQYEVKE